MAKLFDYAKIVVSAVILFFLIKFINGNELLTSIKYVNLWYIILAILIFVVMGVIDVLKIYWCINTQMKMSLKQTFEYFKPIWSLSFFLPSRLGDASWIYVLKKEKMKAKQIFWVLALNLFFTYAFFGIFALFGVDKFFFPIPLWVFVTALWGTLFASIFMFVNLKRTLIWCCSLAKMFMQFAMIWCLTLAFGELTKVISIFDIGITQALTMMVTFLPITIGGLGARESLHVFLFSKLGVQPEVAFLITIMNTIILYASVAVLTLLTKKEALLWKKKEA